jgi:hypothetical protein
MDDDDDGHTPIFPAVRANEGRRRSAGMLVPLQKEVSGEDRLELLPLSCAQASRRLPWMAFPPA